MIVGRDTSVLDTPGVTRRNSGDRKYTQGWCDRPHSCYGHFGPLGGTLQGSEYHGLHDQLYQ